MGGMKKEQKNGASCIDYDWLGSIPVAAFYSRPSGAVPVIPSRIRRGLSPLEPPVTEVSFATGARSDAGVHAAAWCGIRSTWENKNFWLLHSEDVPRFTSDREKELNFVEKSND